MIDDIKKTLWATADKLRANMDAAEYKHIIGDADVSAHEVDGKTVLVVRIPAALAEHLFGTLKRWLVWNHFHLRGLTQVQGELGPHDAWLQPAAGDQPARCGSSRRTLPA
jgi:hypothetical protein